MEGLWRQRELWDGTYDFRHLVEAHEALDMRREGERRLREWAESKR